MLNELITRKFMDGYADFTIQEKDISFQLVSSKYNNNYDNISSINLLECENKLKQFYKINDESSLLIFKIDYIIPELYIPIVECQAFHPETKEPLDFNICKDTEITSFFFLFIDFSGFIFIFILLFLIILLCLIVSSMYMGHFLLLLLFIFFLDNKNL